MLLHRVFFVTVVAAVFFSLTLLLLGGFGPVYAQCEAGTDGCGDGVGSTAPPIRTDCPPGSHPIGFKDCEVDGTGRMSGPQFAGLDDDISILADFNFDGSELPIDGTLQNSNNTKFDRRTANPIAQICSGDSTYNDINYRAYSS